MKHLKTILLFSSLISACNLTPTREATIAAQLRSGKVVEVIRACNDLQGTRDTMFVAVLLQDPYDQRIGHDLRYKGISVYEAKINALTRISGLHPPYKITHNADSANVQFYQSWARAKGYKK